RETCHPLYHTQSSYQPREHPDDGSNAHAESLRSLGYVELGLLQFVAVVRPQLLLATGRCAHGAGDDQQRVGNELATSGRRVGDGDQRVVDAAAPALAY